MNSPPSCRGERIRDGLDELFECVSFLHTTGRGVARTNSRNSFWRPGFASLFLLIHFDVGLFYDLLPLGRLGLDESAELGRTHRVHLCTLGQE